MKKALKHTLTVIFITLTISVFTLVCFGEDLTYTDKDANTYKYTNSGSEITITGFSSKNSDIDLVIPDVIDETPVVKINSSAFGGQPLKSVFIPKSVTQIRENAFAYNPTLEKITFADGISCELYNYAFAGCGIRDLYVPEGVSLKSNVFYGCDKLVTAVLDTQKGRQDYAFNACTALKEASVKLLATGMFSGCESLETVNSSVRFRSLPSYVFNGCKKLTNEMLDKLVDYAHLDKIGGRALQGCASLTYFDFGSIQSNYYYIESYAFADCTGLSEIMLPDRLKTFDDVPYTENVFGGCTGLKRLYLGSGFADTPASIGLENLPSLEAVEVSPDNQKYFSDNGVLYYRDTDGIALLKYPAQKKGSAYSTGKVIESPNGVLKLFDCAFSGVKELKELELTGAVTLDSLSAESSKYRGVKAFENSSVEKITFRDSDFNHIADNMFSGSQIREIDLRNIVSIGDFAFANCRKLEKINLLKCKFLGDGAFADCANLKIAIFGYDSLFISDGVFENDGKITFYCSERSVPYAFATENNIPLNVINIDIPNNAQFPYTGKAVCPGIIVSISGMTLVPEKDYTVEYRDNKAIGTALVTVNFIGDFEGLPEMGKPFTITKRDISELTVEYVEDNLYSGEEIRPAVTVKNGNILLVEGVDYLIKYSSKTNAETLFFTLTGIGNYTGSNKYYYNIVRRDISEAKVFELPDSVYTGGEICPVPTLSWNGFTLVYGEDYEVQWFDNVNSGLGTAVIYGLGNFKGTVTARFKIFGKDISCAEIAEIADSAYTGEEIRPEVSVTLDGKPLKENTDYTVEYLNNTEAGTATVIIRGTGNYSGMAEKTFTVYKNNVYSFTVFSETQMTATYNGAPLKPEMEVYFGSELLKEGVDYTVRLENNVNAGTATVTVCGMGRFEGERSYSFTILPCPFGAEDITVEGASEFDGSAVEPQVKIYKNNAFLENGKDYTVKYFNNTEVGTAYLTVEGIGNYSGNVKLEYEIYPPQNGETDDNPPTEPEETHPSEPDNNQPTEPDNNQPTEPNDNRQTGSEANGENPNNAEASEAGEAQNGSVGQNSAEQENVPTASGKPAASVEVKTNPAKKAAIPKTGGDENALETALWICVTVPALIILNVLDDKRRKKRGKKTLAQRIEDAANDRF